MKVSCYLLDVSMYILIERMDKNIYSTNISAGKRIGSEKSYCNPSHIYLRIIPSNVRNVDAAMLDVISPEVRVEDTCELNPFAP